ncbi:MAG: outer membrane beta-barrel protein, partial [Planctomycetales bacterium]|nr:outer membrane beta-barrel protein [Planctomycetales bacterium]
MAARSVLTLLLACGLTCGGIARGAEVVISDLGQPSAMRSSNSSHMGNSRTYGASPIGHPTTLGQPTPATRYGSRNQDGYRQIQFQDVTIPTAAGSSVGTGVARPVVGNQQIPTPTRTTVPMSEPISEWGPSEEIFSDDWDMACGGCSDSGCTGCGGCGRRQGLVLDLWLSQGFTGNPDDPQNNFNVPVTFNDRAIEYQMNQLYVSLGRAVNTDGHQWDVGGQVDLLYGTDYYFTQAVGLETRIDGSNRWNRSGPRGAGAALYGLAMPQLFAEVYAPIGHGVSVKFGHFYTTIGYESVMAPENFFYSHAYTMQYGEPFTHTGMLADMTIGPRLNIHAGFTRGWDTWEDPNNQLGFLGGYSWTSPSRLASLAMTVHASNEDPAGNFNRT